MSLTVTNERTLHQLDDAVGLRKLCSNVAIRVISWGKVPFAPDIIILYCEILVITTKIGFYND